MKCEYNCNQEAKYQLKNKKWCCSNSSNSCPNIRLKNSEKLKLAYKEGRKNCDHFDGKREWAKGKDYFSDNRISWTKYRNFEEIFCKESPYKRSSLRKLIINHSLLDYKCNCCGLIEWNGKKLCLELEHKNGINNDHRKENLEFLCPNCHSQTLTWRKKKI